MDRWILVSGAGSGIGRAVAKRLAEAGFRIVLSGRGKAKLEETRAGLNAADRHSILTADVREPKAIREGLDACSVPALHAVVACAGIGGENRYGSKDRWREILETNLSGSYYLVNEALPLLRAQREDGDFRHVVLVSSILARLGVPGYSAYCASKAGMLGLTRSWAQAWASERITVNAVCPGWVETQMARQGIETFAEAQGKPFETVWREQMEAVPLRKMSRPEEIAELVYFLVAGGQTSITGQTLDINNGAIMA